MPQCHLYLKGFEVVRHVGFGLATHLLPRPLLEPVELLVYVHLGTLPG